MTKTEWLLMFVLVVLLSGTYFVCSKILEQAIHVGLQP